MWLVYLCNFKSALAEHMLALRDRLWLLGAVGLLGRRLKFSLWAGWEGDQKNSWVKMGNLGHHQPNGKSSDEMKGRAELE